MGNTKPDALTADELIAKRTRLRFTQKEMTEHLGNVVDLRTYQNWEQGHRKVPVWVGNTIKLLNKIHRLE